MTKGWLLYRGGPLFLVALALALVFVVVLLPSLPEPLAVPPPSRTPALRTQLPKPPAPEAAGHVPQPSAAKEESSARQRAASPAVRPAGQAARTNRPDADAIIELERIQSRGDVPVGPPRAPPLEQTRENEFDRSPRARERGVQQFGGTAQTESAVEAGLAWLAAHQSASGIWDRFRFADLDPPDDCCTGRAIRRTDSSLDPGLTGLCVLAFLGAGYTDRVGPYPAVVQTGIDALLAMQQAQGGFGADDAMAGYNDALAAFALAEYYAMTRAPRVAQPLQRAVGRLVRSQQALGGWDYGPWPSSGRNDTSITAWTVQALHACAAAGIEVPRRTLVKAALHFARATEPTGHVRYADAGTGFSLDANRMPRYRYGPAMAAAGLTCAQLLGWRLDGPGPQKQAALLFADPPSAARFQGRDPTELHSENYWYYGTLAMFQRGGQEWERWNARLRDVVLPLQNREKRGEKKRSAYGSWEPYGQRWGKWGEIGSRVYTTAICVLTLEIYYRHTPAYLREEVLLDANAWREYLAETSTRQRHAAVACLVHLRLELAEPALVDLLRDADDAVALAAAEALVSLDSPAGLPVLEKLLLTLPPWGRGLSAQALERARELARLPAVEGRVRVFDEERALATLDLPRAYVGMPISIQRDRQELARLRVVQRFSGRTLVVAELVAQVSPTAPRAGDVAVGG